MTGKQDSVIPGIYRQHMLAGIIVAGHQPVGIDTHGGGTGAEGSHITATFVIWICVAATGRSAQVET